MPTVAQRVARSAPISIRFTKGERALLEAAAGRARVTDSAFIRRAALAAARGTLREIGQPALAGERPEGGS